MSTVINGDNITVPGTASIGALDVDQLLLPIRDSGIDTTADPQTDEVITLSVTGKTVTLPTAVGNDGKRFTIKLTVAGTGTVAADGIETIDGAATYPLAAQWNAVTVVSDGAQWLIVSEV
jgi:hypothetical protein